MNWLAWMKMCLMLGLFLHKVEEPNLFGLMMLVIHVGYES